ncbi:MAG: hypothetical protein NXI31_16490 [bacterium]|nr:hypothetical protein [bacterium]
MRKLTLIGVLFVVAGFGGGMGSFAALAWSGETMVESEWPPKKDGQPRIEALEFDLTPDMNPLAMTVSTEDGGARATVTVRDPAGEVVFEDSQSSDPGSTVAWFFAPIEASSAGKHRFDVAFNRDIDAAVNVRKNAMVIHVGWIFAALGAMFVGFGILFVASIRHATKTMRELRNAPLRGGE